MCETDKQFDAKLIEDYYCYLHIREIAQKEGATETVKEIDKRLKIIKLQLQPIELPE